MQNPDAETTKTMNTNPFPNHSETPSQDTKRSSQEAKSKSKAATKAATNSKTNTNESPNLPNLPTRESKLETLEYQQYESDLAGKPDPRAVDELFRDVRRREDEFLGVIMRRERDSRSGKGSGREEGRRGEKGEEKGREGFGKRKRRKMR